MKCTVKDLIYLLQGYEQDSTVALVDAKTYEDFELDHTSKEPGPKGWITTLWIRN